MEAKAAKENAEAALTQAKAKIEEAKAKQEEAYAAYKAAEARLKELEAEKKEAMDAIDIEKEMAKAKAEIALAEKQAAVYAAELERALLLIQAQVVDAQAAYEKALKNLELAKNGLTTEQKEYLSDYFDAVETWQTKVDELSDALSAAAIELKAAIANLDEKKASAVLLRSLEVAIIKAEAKIAGAEESVAILEAALELDPQTTDWAAEKDKLQAKLDAMEFDRDTAKTEKEKEAAEWRKTIDELREAYEEYENATGFDFEEATGEFSDVAGTKNELPYPNINIPSPKDEEGENLFPDKGDINWKGYEYDDVMDPVTSQPTGEKVKVANTTSEPNFYYKDTEGGLYEKTVVEAFDEAIKAYAAINGESEEANIANRKALIKGQEENPANVALKETYEAMVAAYKAGDPTQYFKAVAEKADKEYDIEKAVADYNAALEAMVKAMDAVNAEYKRLYDAADANEKALLEADAAKETAKAIADGVYYSKLQTALNTYKAAEKTFEAAFFTYQRATNTYNAAMEEAVAAVNALEAPYGLGATPADVAAKIDAALTANASNTDEAYTKAGGPKSVYTTQQAKVKAAQEAYNDAVKTDDATDVWKKAQEAFAKAGGPADCVPAYTPGDPLDFNKVYYKDNAAGQYKKDVDAAYNAWDAAKTAAQTEYDLKAAELANNGVAIDNNYMNNVLQKNYSNAKTALTDAIGTTIAAPPVQNVMEYAVIKSELVAVEMGVKSVPVDYPDYVQFTGNFPDYLVDEDTKALKAIEVADIIDKEYFLATMVKPAADKVYAVMTVSYVDYENKETGETNTSYDVVIGAPADYPLSVPTYEEYVKAIEAFEGNNAAEKAKAYAKEAWRVFANACVASGGDADDNQGGITDYTYSGTETALVFGYKDEIAAFEVAIANVDKAAEHVKVLEAAKAEFEAWAAEEEARIDALGAKVVAEWNEVYPQLKEMLDAEEAYNTERSEIERVIRNLKDLINEYVEVEYAKWDAVNEEWTIVKKNPTDGDIEAFVKALQEAYDAAVIAVGDYEAELADAKTTLEKAKAGDWSYKEDGNTISSSAQVASVKEKQAAYDKAAAELEYALSRLAEATEALKDAMEAIGAVEPEAEETPAE